MSGYIGNIPVPQATQTRDVLTATSGQTSFATSGYTPGFLDVWLNGVKLVNGTDFTATNGSDVVLTSGAAASDIVEVLSYSTFEVNSQTFTGTTTLTGDLQATTATFSGAVTGTDLTLSGDLQATTATFSGAVTGTDLTLSGGVYLGGTGAANYLNDYEEGTWTPTLTSAAGTVTLVVTTGSFYTKIGRTVQVYARLGFSTNASVGTSDLTIGGLPYTAASLGAGNLVSTNYTLGDYGTGGAHGLVYAASSSLYHVVRTVNISSRPTFYWSYYAVYTAS